MREMEKYVALALRPRLGMRYRASRVGEEVTVELRPLSPRRTGGAAFPRPAFLKTLASGMRIPR